MTEGTNANRQPIETRTDYGHSGTLLPGDRGHGVFSMSPLTYFRGREGFRRLDRDTRISSQLVFTCVVKQEVRVSHAGRGGRRRKDPYVGRPDLPRPSQEVPLHPLEVPCSVFWRSHPRPKSGRTLLTGRWGVSRCEIL